MTHGRSWGSDRAGNGVRLVALDVDGTLVGADLRPSVAVETALEEAQATGLVVVLATGRAWPSAARFRERLGVTGPVICYQGAMVRGPDGSEWRHERLAPDFVRDAVSFATARGDDLTAYVDDVVWLEKETHDAAFYERWFGLPRSLARDWSQLPAAPTKLLLIARDAGDGDTVVRAWKDEFDGRVEIVRSHPLFVEAVPPGADKGRALRSVAARLGVDRAQVAAVGDNENDKAMIEWAGLGVAIGGAPAPVAAAADLVAPPLGRDGAAWVLRRLARGTS